MEAQQRETNLPAVHMPTGRAELIQAAGRDGLASPPHPGWTWRTAKVSRWGQRAPPSIHWTGVRLAGSGQLFDRDLVTPAVNRQREMADLLVRAGNHERGVAGALTSGWAAAATTGAAAGAVVLLSRAL